LAGRLLSRGSLPVTLTIATASAAFFDELKSFFVIDFYILL